MQSNYLTPDTLPSELADMLLKPRIYSEFWFHEEIEDNKLKMIVCRRNFFPPFVYRFEPENNNIDISKEIISYRKAAVSDILKNNIISEQELKREYIIHGNN